MQATVGIADDVANFGSYFNSTTICVAEVVANNPRAFFLPYIIESLEDGATVTVRGTMSNSYFNKIWNGTAEGLEGFNVISKIENVPNNGQGEIPSEVRNFISGQSH